MAPLHVPNYIDPPSRAPMVVAVNTTMVSIAFCFVALRIFTRLRLTTIGVDDILICFGWVRQKNPAIFFCSLVGDNCFDISILVVLIWSVFLHYAK